MDLLSDWTDYDYINDNMRRGWLNKNDIDILTRFDIMSKTFPIKHDFTLYRGLETLPELLPEVDGYYHIEQGVSFKSFDINVAQEFGKFLFIFYYPVGRVLDVNTDLNIKDRTILSENVGFTPMNGKFILEKKIDNKFYFTYVGLLPFDYTILYSVDNHNLAINAISIIKRRILPNQSIICNDQTIPVILDKNNKLLNANSIKECFLDFITHRGYLIFSIADHNNKIIKTYDSNIDNH